MPGQSTGQPTLFGMTELAVRVEARRADPEISVQSFGTGITGSSVGGPQPAEAASYRVVSPLANMPLHEVCAFCGADVCAPGFVIPDYEELGAFCNEECGAKRFRLYLCEADDEGSGRGPLR